MANLPSFDDENLTKGGFYTLINQLKDFLLGAIGENGTKDGVKIHLELDSVDNTSDIDKPVSTAMKTELSKKQDSLINQANIKSINNNTLLGAGNLEIVGIPSGCILIWSGSISSIPSGWFLCNGANGTPDLRNKFVYGASSDSNVRNTGGSANAIVVAHSHTATTTTAGNHSHSVSAAIKTGDSGALANTGWGSKPSAFSTSSAGNHSHKTTISSTGTSGTNKNLPPYMLLAYIMKG